MAEFHTYDPKKYIMTWGPYLLNGYAEGTKIKAKRHSDAFSKQVGVDGEVTRSRSNDKSGEVEAMIMQSADMNDLLSAEIVKDELTNSSVYPLLVRDLAGRTVINAENAWVRKNPDIDIADKASPRSYVFDCDNLVIFQGGN